MSEPQAPHRKALTLWSFALGAIVVGAWQFGSLLERGIGWNSVLEYLFFVVIGGVGLGVVLQLIWNAVGRRS
jgi:hypothetical protein